MAYSRVVVTCGIDLSFAASQKEPTIDKTKEFMVADLPMTLMEYIQSEWTVNRELVNCELVNGKLKPRKL